MFKDIHRTTVLIVSICIVMFAGGVVGFIGRVDHNSTKESCESFLPNPARRPGYQCNNDKRVYLKVYDNGSAMCVCKENVK